MTAYIIAGEDTGEGYEWNITDVWYDEETERFFIYSSGGCSCNYAYDEYGYDQTPPMSDLNGPHTFHEVLRQVSVNLVEKVLRWEKENFGENGTDDSIDRW